MFGLKLEFCHTNIKNVTLSLSFLISHLQAGVQPPARVVQHAGGMQVSRRRLFVPLCSLHAAAVSAVKDDLVWMETLMRITVVMLQSNGGC